MNRTIHIAMLTLTAVFLSAAAYAQTNYVLAPNPKLVVAGTSTLHDWVMESGEAKGQGEISLEAGKLADVSGLKITMPVKSLKSGKGGMDDNAYAALEYKKHPQIHFTVSKVTPGAGNSVDIEGKLTVAGQTRTIKSKGQAKASGTAVAVTGKFPMKFSDFGLKPPTAMFGTIKTGDALEISYELNFRPGT